MQTQFQPDFAAKKLRNLLREHARRTHIGDSDERSMFAQPMGCRHTAPAQPHDQHVLSANLHQESLSFRPAPSRRKWISRISDITTETDLFVWRASRRAACNALRSSVRLTRVGLRKDFGLPIGYLRAFYAHKLRTSMNLYRLSELQRRQSKQGTDQRCNPEPRDDFRLLPSLQLKVVMKGRHPKNPLSPQLVRSHLQDHRKRLNHKNAADKRQQEFLLDYHCHRGHRSTQRKRSHVAHKNLGGISVIPEKSKAGPNHGSTENCEFSRLRQMFDIEIRRPYGVPGNIRQDGQG